ncbi:hypothetical protein DDQ68_03610 [Hymenobacter nivis]|uniref:IS1 family transposase n=1 Tax=Hymenobacter nivis TaxID=1850093 RepID=A0A2Z3GJU5_9BACT|nr:hypothetical protein DDQ68_03610 [Hymenobacter nivis]
MGQYADERWSVVRGKKQQRWLWWVEDAARGQVVAFVFGRRTHATFRRLLAVLAAAGWAVETWFTDAWGPCLFARRAAPNRQGPQATAGTQAPALAHPFQTADAPEELLL